MYTIYCDGKPLHDLRKPHFVTLSPKLDLELNSPGTLTFTLPMGHPNYDLPQKMLSEVEVYQDETLIFCGRVLEESVNFYKQKTLTCEGELGFLNDSIQRPAEYHDLSVREYLEILIKSHNDQVDESKQFEVGTVTISDSNDSLYRYTNYNSTMTEIKEDLVDDYGGYLRVRHEDDKRYLDYISLGEYGGVAAQEIKFGKNLLDYSQTMDASDIATVIIPLGATLEESDIPALDLRLTIESVNDGKDYLESTEAVSLYGRITTTVIWDDVTVASNLKTKGEEYLSNYQWDAMELEVSAIDLHYTDAQIEELHLGDEIRVVSEPHGLDRYFPITKMSLQLDALENNSFTLGTMVDTSLTSRVVGQSGMETNISAAQSVADSAMAMAKTAEEAAKTAEEAAKAAQATADSASSAASAAQSAADEAAQLAKNAGTHTTLTSAEYDALPDTKLTDNVYYYISDTGEILQNGLLYG